MRGETALTRRPVTRPRRLSAGKPQWLPGGAKGCARRDSNPNLLIRRHRPMVRSGTIRVLLSCGWRCREARLSSSLSSELSSAHGAKQRHPRFLIHPASYPAARNYAIPTGVIGRRRSSPFQPRCPCTWQTIGSSMSAADDGKLSNWPVNSRRLGRLTDRPSVPLPT